jgi:hypothetical protein
MSLFLQFKVLNSWRQKCHHYNYEDSFFYVVHVSCFSLKVVYSTFISISFFSFLEFEEARSDLISEHNLSCRPRLQWY